MSAYRPPLRDMQFILHEVLETETALRECPPYAEIDRALIDQILESGGQFASEVLEPLSPVGDQAGCRYDPATRSVTTPPGFRDAYRQFAAAGWTGLACDPAYGGQGLPESFHAILFEMLGAANQAWTLAPALIQGVYECLHHFGTPWQQSTFLPRLVSGEWLATMCLTEPQAGSDLSLLRTLATDAGDGSFLLQGNKIFISGGDSDLADNIIHLVLARLPDAPAGTRGISLFLVPKFLVAQDGGIGERNPIFCTGIEHKMGLHGSPTCQMSLEDARGWMIGAPNRGLDAMFILMNAARLGVGMQSIGLAELAYQRAAEYAQERIQSRSAAPQRANRNADPIIDHPDVRRLLLTARAQVEGGRAFSYFVALQLAVQRGHGDPDRRREAGELAALLTPVIKSFLSENAFLAISDCLQVFGGHGYVRDNRIEQLLRDARINMIYEGTNAIQGIDLLGRKVLSDQGAALNRFLSMIETCIESCRHRDTLSSMASQLADLIADVRTLTTGLAQRFALNREDAIGAATSYLRVIGHVGVGYAWLRMAAVADAGQQGQDGQHRFYRNKLELARFYFARLLPDAAHHLQLAALDSGTLMSLAAEDF